MEPQQNNHSRRGAHAPLREEILSTPAPSSAIARRRQGDEVPSTGDTRDRYGRLLRSLSLLKNGKSSLTLRNRHRSENSACGTTAKESARRTDSRELPAELALQHRSLWQGAVCTLRAAIHSPGAGAQLPGSRATDVALICGLSRPTVRRVRVAPLDAGRRRGRFGPTQDSRQNGFLACGVWHSPLPLSVLPVSGGGGAVPPSSGFGRFRLARVSGNAHKPLTSQEETHYG